MYKAVRGDTKFAIVTLLSDSHDILPQPGAQNASSGEIEHHNES